MRLTTLLLAMFVSIGLWAGAWNSANGANKIIRIAGAENHTTHALAAAVVKEAYRRIGFEPRISFLPNRRSLAAAADGWFDGELGRIAGAEKKFPDLIRVPEPVVWIEGVVATLNETPEIRGWDELRDMSVAIIRGEIYSEKGTAGLSVPPLLANNYNQLLALLIRGRVKAVIGIRADLRLAAVRYGKDRIFKISETPLFSAPLFHLVHKKNRSLVPRLEAVLRKMAEQLVIPKLHNMALEKLKSK